MRKRWGCVGCVFDAAPAFVVDGLFGASKLALDGGDGLHGPNAHKRCERYGQDCEQWDANPRHEPNKNLSYEPAPKIQAVGNVGTLFAWLWGLKIKRKPEGNNWETR